MVERIPFNALPAALGLGPGVTAVVGSGGKTTLIATLGRMLAGADGCAADGAQGGEGRAAGQGPANDRPAARAAAGRGGATVVLATSTRILPFPGTVLYTGSSEEALRALLGTHRVVCCGTPAEQGKLAACALPFRALAACADYVLVEADGSHRLPLKAHAPHEPAVPPEAARVLAVVGASGFGRPVGAVVHRPELFCRLAGCSAADKATPARVARGLLAECAAQVPAAVLVNQVDNPELLAQAALLQHALGMPVLAASLRQQRLWRIG